MKTTKAFMIIGEENVPLQFASVNLMGRNVTIVPVFVNEDDALETLYSVQVNFPDRGENNRVASFNGAATLHDFK
jgi:hypothetical protein